MKTPTYKEQFDKLTEAYINNKVVPSAACKCFVGNLLNGQNDWVLARDNKFNVMKGDSLVTAYKQKAEEILQAEAGGLYTLEEIYALEKNFYAPLEQQESEYLKQFSNSNSTNTLERIQERDNLYDQYLSSQEYEDLLFERFSSTLEMLKEIHRSKGEDVEGEFEFKKRELACA